MQLNGYLMSGDKATARIEQGRLTPILPDLMPLYLTARDDLKGWLESRAIDRHRPNSRILKKVLRLTETDDLSTVLRVHGATVTDNYWIKPDSESELSYSQVRFSINYFADLALTGRFESYNHSFSDTELHSRSPELTNIGSYEKCWRLADGAWYLYKQGTPLERYSELFIAQLGKAFGFSTAEYEADGDYIRSRDFTEGRLNFEPAASVVGDNEDYEYNYDRISALSPALLPAYLDLLFMDALCYNMDRHTLNYGFLRDQSTGKIASMAPNFDNNIALIARGYGVSPEHSNGLLIDLFLDLLRAKGVQYAVPELPDEQIIQIARDTLPGESIDRDYVARFIADRYHRLENQIQSLESSGPTMSHT